MLLILLSNPAMAQTPAAGNDWPALPRLQPDAIREDFAIARAALEEGHAGLYRFTPKREMDRVFEREASALTASMTAVEFRRPLARVIAAIKDVHTSVRLPHAMAAQLDSQVRVLPFQVKVLQHRLYVFRDFSDSVGGLAGQEILSINGAPSGRLITDLIGLTSGDGDVEVVKFRPRVPWRVNRELPLSLGIVAPYDVEFRPPTTQRTRRLRFEGIPMTALSALSAARYPRDLEIRKPAVSWTTDGRIACMTLSTFEDDPSGKWENLEHMFRESFAELERRHTETLILDLRNNGGGRDEVGRILYSFIATGAFQYYDSVIVRARSFAFMKYVKSPELPDSALVDERNGRLYIRSINLGTYQPSPDAFKGRVIIVMNGGCVSGCAEFVSIARRDRRAVFVGEECGGGYAGNASGVTPRVTLPNSQLEIVVPLFGYYLAVGHEQSWRRGVAPDYDVRYTIDELISGGDKELELARRLADTR